MSLEGRGWPDGLQIKKAIDLNSFDGRVCPRYIPSTRTITKKQLKAMMARGHWDAIGKVFGFKPRFLFNEADNRVFDWRSCPPEMTAVLQRSNKSPSQKIYRVKYAAKKTARTRLHESQDGRCYYCGRRVALGAFTTDHITPRCRGGKGPSNTVGSCKSCNNAKGSMTLTEFLETDYLPNERRALLGFPDEPAVNFQEARDQHGKRIADYWSNLVNGEGTKAFG